MKGRAAVLAAAPPEFYIIQIIGRCDRAAENGLAFGGSPEAFDSAADY